MARVGGIVLCAGYGSRLRPLTDVVPKPAVPFLGVPMAVYAFESLRRLGVVDLAMNVHHLPEVMTSVMSSWLPRIGLSGGLRVYREEGGLLGTGGGARGCAQLLPACDRYVIYHGDVLCGVDLSKVLALHVQRRSAVTMVVTERRPGSTLGMIGLDVLGRVVQIRDWCCTACEVVSWRCFAGIHVIEHDVLSGLAPGLPHCLVTELYRGRLEAGMPIEAYDTSSFFADIGTPETYLEAQAACLENGALLPELRCREVMPAGVKVVEPVAIYGGVRVGGGAILGPNVCLCEGGRGVEAGEAVSEEMRFEGGRIGRDGAG